MTDNLPGVSPVAQDDDSKVKNQPIDPMMSGGGMAKEQMESSPTPHVETAPVVEVGENEKVPEAVENWIEKLEQGEEIKLPQPVTDDGKVLVQSSDIDIDEETIILPMSENQQEEGMHKKVYKSARWLAEWCVMVAKKLHGHVTYRTGQLEKEGHGKA